MPKQTAVLLFLKQFVTGEIRVWKLVEGQNMVLSFGLIGVAEKNLEIHNIVHAVTYG